MNGMGKGELAEVEVHMCYGIQIAHDQKITYIYLCGIMPVKTLIGKGKIKLGGKAIGYKTVDTSNR